MKPAPTASARTTTAGTTAGSAWTTSATNSGAPTAHEGGTSSDAAGHQVTFNLDDNTGGSFSDDATGTDTEAAGTETHEETSHDDEVSGTTTLTLGESGTTVRDGSTITFSLSDN